MKERTFRGSPAEIGAAQGAMDPGAARAYVDFWLARPHDFEAPYFRKNLAFMRREFPDLVEQIEAFAEAAGMPFDHAWYSHLHWTGASEACSTLGIVLEEDGPAMLSTNDGHDDTVPGTVDNTVVSIFPDTNAPRDDGTRRPAPRHPGGGGERLGAAGGGQLGATAGSTPSPTPSASTSTSSSTCWPSTAPTAPMCATSSTSTASPDRRG